MGLTLWPIDHSSTTWPGPLERVQKHQEPDLPKVEGEVLGSDLTPRGPGYSLTPRVFQPTSLPPSSPISSTARPDWIPAVRLSPIPQSRNSPIVTSKQIKPVANSSGRREELSPLAFPSTQLFQQRERWLIQVTREDPNTASENQDSVARLFRRVD
ncbi:hypothetical protein O181_069785 [Austropuccinia psidii MF-1]|uniref:Uncharacterized protein n=1 Tax=Austropuccinia psidii MF-1 TaxID=1389203 RepID=A0A9Q3EV57_9BASI|nr:hypothetical protein [Austropuccinia psidii MF-1]